MSGNAYILLFILIVPVLYILFYLRELKEKAGKWEEYDKCRYEGYVKNIEEMLRERESLSFTSKVDYVFLKLKELFDTVREKRYRIYKPIRE